MSPVTIKHNQVYQ